MRGPRHLGPYPDRHLDCQEATEPGFMALIDAVEAAGWVREEIIEALAELARNFALAEHANAETDDQIAAIRRDQG